MLFGEIPRLVDQALFVRIKIQIGCVDREGFVDGALVGLDVAKLPEHHGIRAAPSLLQRAWFRLIEGEKGMSAKIGEYRARERGVPLGTERLSKGPSDEAGVVVLAAG